MPRRDLLTGRRALRLTCRLGRDRRRSQHLRGRTGAAARDVFGVPRRLGEEEPWSVSSARGRQAEVGVVALLLGRVGSPSAKEQHRSEAGGSRCF